MEDSFEYPWYTKYSKRTRELKEGTFFEGNIDSYFGQDYYWWDNPGTLLEYKESVQELCGALKPKDREIFLVILNYSNARKRNMDRKRLLDMLHGENNWNQNHEKNFNNAMKRIKAKAFEIGLNRYYWFEGNIPEEPDFPIATLPVHAYTKKSGRQNPPPQFKRHRNVFPKVKELEGLHGEVKTFYLNKEDF